MAVVTVGNSRIGSTYLKPGVSWGGQSEPNLAYSFIHYKFIADRPCYEKKITVNFYVRKPTSSGFAAVGLPPPDFFIPAVFTAENGEPAELLNETSVLVSIMDMPDGWYSTEIPLTRNFNVGEEIWGGVWSTSLCPIWDESAVSRGVIGSRLFYTGYSSNYLKFFENRDITGYDYGDSSTIYGHYSLYWSFFDAPLSKNYSVNFSESFSLDGCVKKHYSGNRGIIDIGRTSGFVSRSSSWKRNLDSSADGFGFAGRKTFLRLSGNSRFSCSDSILRGLGFFRETASMFAAGDVTERRILFARFFEEIQSFLDFASKVKIFLASVKVAVSFGDETQRLFHSKRKVESLPDFIGTVERGSLLFRTAESAGKLRASVFSSRIIWRFASAALSLWDFLRGKIREENLIVELFTPIADELFLDCRI